MSNLIKVAKYILCCRVIQLPKSMGLGSSKGPIGNSAKQKIMFALQREINKHLNTFLNSSQKKLTFSAEFTKDERKMIHK